MTRSKVNLARSKLVGTKKRGEIVSVQINQIFSYDANCTLSPMHFNWCVTACTMRYINVDWEPNYTESNDAFVQWKYIDNTIFYFTKIYHDVLVKMRNILKHSSNKIHLLFSKRWNSLIYYEVTFLWFFVPIFSAFSVVTNGNFVNERFISHFHSLSNDIGSHRR